MASDDTSLGSLGYGITGDFSDLQDALTQASALAESSGQAIADALNVPVGDDLVAAITSVGEAAEAAVAPLSGLGEAASQLGDSGSDVSSLTDAVSAVGEAADSVAPSLSDAADAASALGDSVDDISPLSDSLDAVSDSASNAAPALEDTSNSAHDVGESSEEAEGGIAGLAEQFLALAEALAVTEALKEFGEEALNAYGTVQSVTIGLTQLTGSVNTANEAVEQIKELASTEPFAFPDIAPTIQKMVALGVSAEQLPGVMQAVADASAATGNAFSQVANSLDRMSLSGTAGARQLTQLGISTTDLGNAMGVSAAQVTVAFKALDQSERLEVLQTALEKFAGSAEAQAQGISGQWQIFQNNFEEVMVGVGSELAPVVGAILQFGETVLSVTQSAIATFDLLPAPIKDTVVAVGLVIAAIAPLAAGVAAAGFAIIGFNTALATGAEILESFGIISASTAAAETTLAAETVAVGAAGTEAAAGLGVAEVAATGLSGTFMALSTGATGLLVGLGEDVVAAGAGITAFVGGLATAGGGITAFISGGVASLGTALSGLASGGVAAMIAALPILATSVLVAADAFASWELGSWIEKNMPGSTQLDTWISDLISKIPLLQTVINAWAGASNDAGISTAALTKLIPTLQANLADVGVTIDQGAMTSKQYATALMAAAAAHGVLTTATGNTTSSQGPLISAIDAVYTKVEAQNLAVSQAKAVMDALTQSNDGSAKAVQLLASATATYQTAVQAANEKGKDWADTIAGISQAQSLATEKAQSAIAVYTALNASSDGTAASLANVAAAYKKAETAATAAGQAFATAAGQQALLNQGYTKSMAVFVANAEALTTLETAYNSGTLSAQKMGEAQTQIVQLNTQLQSEATALGTSYYNQQAATLSLTNAATNQQTVLQNVVTTYEGLKTQATQTSTSIEAAATAFKTIQTDAAALGLTVTQVGTGLQFTATNAQTATPQVLALATQLTNAANQGKDFVTVNGQMVPMLGAAAQAAQGADQQFGKVVSTWDGGTVSVIGLSNAVPKATAALTAHAAAASTAAVGVNSLSSAAQQASVNGLDPFSQRAVAASVSLSQFTGGVTGAVSNLTGPFSAAAVAATADTSNFASTIITGAQAMQNVGARTSAVVTGFSALGDMLNATSTGFTGLSETVQIFNEDGTSTYQILEQTTAEFGDAEAAADAYAGALNGLSQAADLAIENVQDLSQAVQSFESILGQAATKGGTATATPGSTISTGGLFSPSQYQTVGPAGTAPDASTGPETTELINGIQTWVAMSSLIQNTVTPAVTGWYSSLAQYQAAQAKLTAATSDNTTATTSAASATDVLTTAVSTAATTVAASTDTTTAASTATGLLASSGAAANDVLGTLANMGGNTTLTMSGLNADMESLTDSLNAGTITLAQYNQEATALSQYMAAQSAAIQTFTGAVGTATTALGVLGTTKTTTENGDGTATTTIQNPDGSTSSTTSVLPGEQTTGTGSTGEQAMGAVPGLIPGFQLVPGTTNTYEQTPFAESTGGVSAMNAAGGAMTNPYYGSTGWGTNVPNGSTSGGLGYTGPPTPAYSTGNPLPVTIQNPQAPNINVTIQAGTVVGQNGAQQLTTMVQQSIVTMLRQAGLKI